MKDDEFERTHESYGMLHIARMSSGSCRLFGSPLATHYGTIRLTISKATWTHGLHHDRYFGMSKEHIEIEMSQAQFADAITSLNMGSGTPCTIRYLDGKRVADPPDHATESEYIQENFEAKFGDMSKRTKEYADRIKELTSKLPAKTRRDIEIALDVMQQQINSSVPFVLKQFREATTKITTAAKAEVDGFVTAQIRNAGLQAIAAGFAPLMPGTKPKLTTEEAVAQLAAVGLRAAPDEDAREALRDLQRARVIKAGECPACHSFDDCVAQCPNAGMPRCERAHIQNCYALKCADDSACDYACDAAGAVETGVKP